MKVYYTVYDGFYVVVTKNRISFYEGEALLPKKVLKWLESNKPIQRYSFYYEIM